MRDPITAVATTMEALFTGSTSTSLSRRLAEEASERYIWRWINMGTNM